MEIARDERRILITNDRGFGEKCFRERRPHHGVVFLRLSNERAANKIRVLDQLIRQHSDALPHRFVVATETRVRFAKS
jgi:NAD(P) transhydrogenase subunit alpha